jgi:hypothetical protein
MMYQVHWVSEAEEELAAVWIRAGDRDLITRTAFSIDRMLEDNPEIVGESRSGDHRILLIPPLGVTFSVSLQNRTVLVLNVWRFDPRRQNP